MHSLTEILPLLRLFFSDIEHLEYFPYGEVWVNERTDKENYDLPYKYTGKEYDPETKLTYYGARYYDAQMSRWISADPPLISGAYLPTGDKKKDANLPGLGGVFNPINLNGYQYGANNPVKYVDADGNEIDTSNLTFSQKIKYQIARIYIGSTPRGRELLSNMDKKVTDGGLLFKLEVNNKESSTYKYKSNTILWNPDEGLIVFDGESEGRQTPAISLAHEMGHGEQEMNGVDFSNKLNKFTHEDNNIEKTEKPIVNQLNNGVRKNMNKKEGIRDIYMNVGGHYKANNVISTEGENLNDN